ncbi:MAG: VWA domain-containing protein [Ardenticatenaceae bacterium]|nr:VWA domain-containing protein [Ardenticatenaceae bacterium]
MKQKWIFFFLLLSLLTIAGHALAQEPTPALPDIIEPPIWEFDGLRIEYQRVNVTIENQVATTHIDQLFVNDNDWMLEGQYLFPLPEGAAVSQLTMWVDGNPIEAKILERDEAQQIYDNIVRQMRDPALLKYVGTQAIQANVFPIPPRDERRIEIEYTQVLPADNGLIHYVYPQSTDLYTNTPLDEQSIRVEVQSNEAIRAIYSPSHRVDIFRDGEFRAVAGFEEANVNPTQDYELYYSVSPENIGLNLLTYREAGQDGFFLLLVAPSVTVDEVVAKDVILVVDTSGSMEGEKMTQAKEAARYVIEHLNDADRFNIVAFSTGVRSFAPELVTAENAGDYDSFINSMEALGGTNISQALLEAAAMADAERPTTILFLTDGLATEGITDTPLLLDSIEQATPDNVRIFAFGVGDDVDTLLLDSLAANQRGTSTYVRPFEAIDEEVSAFYAKVSTPVLANISLDFGGVAVDQLYPTELPDLFAGTQLVLTGRYRAGGAATITLSGDVNGRTQTFSYADNTFRSSGGDEFIPRLWATRAIGHLLTQIRLHGEDPELVQSVVNLSIRYGIITPYTSYLIEEDDIFSQAGRNTIVEEEMESMTSEDADFTGSAAVDEAAAVGEMAEAEAPMAMPLPTTTPAGTPEAGVVANAPQTAVQYVGSKTFVLRNGLWIDTAYDADAMTPQQVGFASDAYFDLLAAAPELGNYFALGQRVLVVYGGQVYEIVEGDGAATVELPQNGTTGDGGVTGETAVTSPTTSPTAVQPLANEGNPDEAAGDGVTAPETETAGINWLLYGLGVLLLLIVIVVAGRLATRR